tara:strand:+ start:16 stop:597 length:582 start_codon:yes stop_codon:yes gene_type:complete
MAQDNLQIKDVLEQNILNVIFYENSFTKTAFFVKILSKWNIPIFYLDFDLLYSGFVKSGQTSLSKNTTLLCPNADSLHENLRSIIDKISKIKSLVIIDSLNGFFNLLEDKKDTGKIINSFIMLLVSSAKNANSVVVIGSLSKLINENEWVLYNTGRHVIENKYMTKIQLTESDGNIVVKSLERDKSKNTIIFS